MPSSCSWHDWGALLQLGFVWDEVEVAPGVYNTTFLDNLEALVDRFAARGMMCILDQHQDNWSPIYCGGHGIPSFYGTPYNTSEVCCAVGLPPTQRSHAQWLLCSIAEVVHEHTQSPW